MCPAGDNHVRPLYEIHLQDGGNVSTFTLSSIKDLFFYYNIMGPQCNACANELHLRQSAEMASALCMNDKV